MNDWNDFENADAQRSFEVIPRGTLVPVRMILRPGGHDDPQAGWTGGWATRSPVTGAVYLSCEFVVLAGPYARRKLWTNIGLYSEKGPAWGRMGRATIRAILNSAHNLHPDDHSPQAAQARRIADFSALDGIVFVARLGVEKDSNDEERNVVRAIIEPDHKDYAAQMALAHGKTATHAASTATASVKPADAAAAAAAKATGRPSWAQ